jgi:hypothetical protein
MPATAAAMLSPISMTRRPEAAGLGTSSGLGELSVTVTL